MKGAEMAAIRERIGITQGELARLLDVAKNTVSRWEQEDRTIHRRDELAVRFLETRAGRQWTRQQLAG